MASKHQGRGKKTRQHPSQKTHGQTPPIDWSSVVELLEPRVLMSAAHPTSAVNSAAYPGAAGSSLIASQTKTAGVRQLIAIDASLAAQGLVPSTVDATTRIVLLQPGVDPLQQITAALAPLSGVRSIQILTHGIAGELELSGATGTAASLVVDQQTLAADAPALAQWSKSTTSNATIALYGCDVAQGKVGRAFVQAFARRTGMETAASTDPTGPASLGGNWTLEYIAGGIAPLAPAPDVVGYHGLLSGTTVTVSAGTTTHVVGMGATAIDPGLTLSNANQSLAISSASVAIASGYLSSEDVLALPTTTGFNSSFNAVTGTLTVTSTSAQTLAQFQTVLRTVTYQNSQSSFAHLDGRQVTFTVDSTTSSAKSLALDLPVDLGAQQRIQDALGVVDAIGTAITNLSGTPYSDSTTGVPYTGSSVKNLLYPSTLSTTVQPQQIGTYLQLQSAASTYFQSAGTITDLTGLDSALQTKLATLVTGGSPLLSVTSTFNKPADTDTRSISMTVTIQNSKGPVQTLQLDPLTTDLGMSFPDGPTVQVGGGADIQFTITLNLQGHQYGGNSTSLPKSDVTLAFNQLNALAGFAFSGLNTTANIGAIGAQLNGASGIVGALLPVTLRTSSQTLNLWSANGSEVTGFATNPTGVANITLPISASIGGVSATTANTKVVVSDDGLLTGDPFTYTTTDYDQLRYFGAMSMSDVIAEVQKVAQLYSSLSTTDSSLFGVQTPFLNNITLGQLADFGTLFDNTVGATIDATVPVLTTAGRDQLSGANLPLASGSTSLYSDLQSEFQFGVSINGSATITTIDVAKDTSRTSLANLVADINSAFSTAHVKLVASQNSGKLSFTASDNTVTSFALVPVAPAGNESGETSPSSPPGDLTTLTVNQPYFYSVTGTTSGTVTGTTYYTTDTPVAAAAVHAGILAAGQTGVVEVVYVGSVGDLAGTTKNGVTSNATSSDGNAYYITYAGDLTRLGVGSSGSVPTPIPSQSGVATATLPLETALEGAAAIQIAANGSTYTVNVAANSNTSVTQTLTAVQSALVSAGISASNLAAQLVDATGNALSGSPAAGTAYYLSFYEPSGSTWTSYTVAPTSNTTAYKAMPLGFFATGASTTQPGLLQTAANGAVTATLALQPVLPANASIEICGGGKQYTVNVAPNNSNTTAANALTNVQAALVTAGIASSDLTAQLVDSTGNPAAGTDAGTYYLSFYLPAGSNWTTFAVAPVTSATAYKTTPLGFFTGDESSPQPSPDLGTFQELATSTAGLTITPVYDATAHTVTLDFSASSTTSASQAPAVTFDVSPLGKVNITSSTTVTPSVTTNLSFGVQFQIGPAAPVVLNGSTALPANGQSASDSAFTLGFALGNSYSVSVPHSWTTSNATPQDLVSDINLALQSATVNGSTTDATGQIIATLGSSGNLALTNATPVGSATTLTQTNGVLSADLKIAFTYQGAHYILQLPHSTTTGNTSFSQLIPQLNTALASVVIDANNNGQVDAGEQTTSLASQLFFTTISSSGGAANSKVYLYSTSTSGADWPTSITLSASRTDPMVATLGFGDGATGDTSIVSATATGITAALVKNGTNALASVAVKMPVSSLAGTVAYGFNTLEFSGAIGSIANPDSGQSHEAVSALDSVALNTNGLDISTVAGNLGQYLTRTMSSASGTGDANASLTLTGITDDSGNPLTTPSQNPTIQISVADLSAGTAVVNVDSGQPIPIPGESNGVLSSDATVNFINGATLYSVTVHASQTTSNASFAALVSQFNAALANASSTSAGTTTTVDASSLFQFATAANDQLQVTVATTESNPNYASITLGPSTAAFGSIGLQGAFSSATVADALTQVVPLLDNLQATMPVLSTFNLPLINTSVDSLIHLKGNLLNQVSAFSATSVSSYNQLAPALAAALGIPANQVNVSFDTANNAFRVDVQYQTGVATTKPLNITLANFYQLSGETEPAGLSRLVDTGSSSPLTVKIGATITLALGIDLTDPSNPRPFLYGYDGSGDYGLSDGTSIKLNISAAATDINFTSAVGALGVFVRGGTATLGGPVFTGNDGNPVYDYSTNPNELTFVTQSNDAILGVGLQGSAENSTTDASGTKFYLTANPGESDATNVTNYQPAFTGSVQAELPLYTPTEFINPFQNRSETVNVNNNGTVTSQTVSPGGNVFDLEISDLGAYSTDVLSSAASSQSVSIYTPDVEAADGGIVAPTLIDALQDPSLLVDGIDAVLGGVQTALQGLDDLNIPVIGGVLGDAVQDVLSWRNGWLHDLDADLRNRGDSVFSEIQNEVFNYLGPSGLNLLLQDNNASGVNSIVPATGPSDVALEFLDGSGNPITAGTYGADAVQFEVHLGSLLLDTGTSLGLNFDSLAPAFTLALNGGLTFKLGWDATIGFGYSLTDGFYVVTNSTPDVNQVELQFAAGFSGAESKFTVVATDSSFADAGYGIQDGSGNWVTGPDGSKLNVLEVDSSGNPITDPQQIQVPSSNDCNDGDGSSSSSSSSSDPTYWVVAVDNGSGTLVPAYLDALSNYQPQTPDGSGNYNADQEIQYNQTAPFSATGSLFFLNLKAVDQPLIGLHTPTDADYYFSTDDAITSAGRNDPDTGVNRNNTLPTLLSGTIGIKLVKPEDNADPGQVVAADDPSPSDDRITLQDFEDAGSKIFQLDIKAQAVVNLNLTLSVGDNAAIPKLTASFNLDWKYEKTFGGPDDAKEDEEGDSASQKQADKLALLPEVGLNNIRLDMGTFLTQFIKPIADKVNDVMQPIDPLLTDLQTPIPVLSDIAGHPVRLTTLLSDFGGGDGEALATLIDIATEVGQLSAIIANLPANEDAYLPIGNFWLAKVGAGPGGEPGMGTQIYYDNSEITPPSIAQRNQSLIAGGASSKDGITSALSSLDNLDANNPGNSQPGVDSSDRGGFDLPILDNPLTIFKILMGEDEPLVTFSLPKLNFTFDQDIPLIHIVCFDVGIHLNISIQAQLQVGYDTFGLREFMADHNPADILDGFYVSTRANADGTGAPVDAIDVHASIGLYGGVDLWLVKAGIEGGFELNASISWNDPNNDGKLRVPEVVSLIEAHDNPLDLVNIDIEGDVYARYYYWVGIDTFLFGTITLYSGGDTFAEIPLFDINRQGQDGPPAFASLVTTTLPDGTSQPDTLLLNMGPNAAQRVSNEDPLNEQDGSEHFTITNSPSDPGTVTVTYNNYSNSYTETYHNVARVVAYGGEGNDEIDASGLNGLPVDLEGGDGNDTIMLGSGSDSVMSTIDGGSGNDSITVSGGGLVTINVDGSNDTVQGGSGAGANDTFVVSSGSNSITAGGNGATNSFQFSGDFGTNALTLSSAAAVNLLDFTNASNAITATLSGTNSTISAGSTNKVTFNLAAVTQIRGTPGDDVFNVTDPTTRNANSGKGLILQGGPGDDSYNVTANDLSNVASNGITIDDGEYPTATATLGTPVLCQAGDIMSIPITSGGSGYIEPPEVVITDSTGSGARALASIDGNGTVTGIYLINGGIGYTDPTVTLVEPTDINNKLTFTSNTTGTVTLDGSGNSNTAYELSTSAGGPIKWVGYTDPGVVRPANYGVDEINSVKVQLPTGTLALDSHLDLEGDLTVSAQQLVQNAPITANDVSITTADGFAADYPIDTVDNGDILIHTTGQGIANYVSTIATATATVVNGAVTGFTITNPGSGYMFPPAITIDDPNGSGAQAIAEITGGQLTGIILVSGGHGYLSIPAPTVNIAPSSSIQLNTDLTTSTVGSAPGTGDGRGTVTLRADLGEINQSGTVQFPAGSNVGWQQGDFLYTSTNSLDQITNSYTGVSVGSGATATAVLDSDGRVTAINVSNGGSGYSKDLLPTVQIDGDATATAIVDDAGQITGFNITYPGEGYATAPTVTIVPNAFGRIVGVNNATTALNRDHITSLGGSLVAVAYYGIGDPSNPIKTEVANMVGQTFALAAGIHVLQNNDLTIGQKQSVDGLSTVNGDVSVTNFTGQLALGSPVQLTDASGNLLWQDAAKTVPIYATNPDGSILYQGGQITAGTGQVKLTADGIDVNNYISAQGGQLVLQPTKADANIGLPGTGATASAALTGGQVTGFDNLVPGIDYQTTPLVQIAPPGQRAYATATVLDGAVNTLTLTYGGTNYNDTYQPIVTLVGGGVDDTTPANQATATATYSDGQVTGFTIANAGSGYVSAPTVMISLPGAQATATAILVNGKVTGFTIVNPGANYAVAPAVTIDRPFPFVLSAQELAYFRKGFGSIVVGRADGRHQFYAPQTTFNDALTLRSPLGGTMQVQNLAVNGAPLTIIGNGLSSVQPSASSDAITPDSVTADSVVTNSVNAAPSVGTGQGMELTTANPMISATSVLINDNVIVDDGTNGNITATAGDVVITGSGVGNIDGNTGATTANLEIDATGNILVGGAVGSSVRLQNLDLNKTNPNSGSSFTPGNITLQGNVSLSGNLHIYAGQNVTLGGNVNIAGNLIIDQGASVAFNGSVTVGGNLTISQANTVSFAQNVSVGGAFSVGSSANVQNVTSLTFGPNARVDVAGAVAVYTDDDITFGNRIGQTSKPASITLDTYEGDINFQNAVATTTGGTLSIVNANNVTFSGSLTAGSLQITLAQGNTVFYGPVTLGAMNVTCANLVQIAGLTLNSGSGTITANTVNFDGGNGSIRNTGNAASTFTVEPYDTTRAITIGSPPGVYTSLDISDVDLAAIASGFGRVNFGDSVHGTGTVTIGSIGSQEGAGNSQLFNNTSIFGGNINLVQNVDSAAATGDLTLVAATGNITITAAINSVSAERCATVILQTLAGNININSPVYAGTLLRLLSSGSITEGTGGFVNSPTMRITAGGAVTMSNAGNNLGTVAINSNNNAITLRNDSNMVIGTVDGVTGINSGTANTSLTDNGVTITQTDPITAAGLNLVGTGSTFTLLNSANDCGVIAANTGTLSYTDANTLTVGTVGSTLGIQTANSTTVNSGDTLTVSNAIAATAGAVTLGSSNNIAVNASSNISGTAVSLTAFNGVSLGSTLTSTAGDVMVQASHTAITATDVDGINATGNVNLTANTTITGGGPISATGTVSLNASTDVSWDAAGIINAGGNVSFSASNALTDNAAVTSANGTVSMDSHNADLTASGAISAKNQVTYQAQVGSIYDSGTISSSAAGVSLTAGSGISETDAAGITAAGNVTLSAQTDISGGGPIITTGTVQILAQNDITLDPANTIHATGDITLDATNTLRVNGAITSTAGAVLLQSDSDSVYTDAAVSGANGVTSYAHLLNDDTGAITAAGGQVHLKGGSDLHVEAASNIIGTSVDLEADQGISLASSVTSTAGDVTVNAATSLAETDAAAITSAGNVTLTGPYSITGGGAISAAGTVTLQSTSATGFITWDATGAIAAAGNISFTSQSMTDSGALTSTAGTVTLDATGGTLTTNAAVSGHNGVTYTGGADVSDTGAITASAGPVSIIAATTLTVNAGSNISGQSITLTGYTAVSLASNMTSTAGDVTLASQTTTIDEADTAGINATGNVSLTATQHVDGGGPITATGTVTLHSLHNLTWDAAGAIHAAGDVQLIAANTLSDSAAITSTAGTVALTATSSTLTTNAAVSGYNGVTYTAGGDISDTGAIGSSNGPVTFSGANITVVASSAITADSINLTASQAVSIASNLVATVGDASITSQNSSITFQGTAGINASGSIALTADTDITGGGTITDGGTITATAGHNFAWTAFSPSDVFSTAGDIAITATNSLSDTAAITSTGGTVALTATSSTMSVSGALESHGDLALLAGDSIQLSAPADSASGAVSISATTDIAVASSSPVSGNTITVSAGHGVTLASGLLSRTGDLSVTAHASSSISLTDAASINSAGDVTLIAPQDITGGGAVSAAGTVSYQAGHDITLDASNTVIADGNVSLTASDAMTANSAITSTSGTVLLAAASAGLATDAAVSGDAGVQLSAGTTLAEVGAVTATHGNIVVGAGGDVSIAADSPFSGEQIAINGDNISGASTLTSTSSFVNLSAEGGSIAMTDAAAITSAQDVDFSSQLDITGGGAITAAGTVTLVARRGMTWDAAGTIQAGDDVYVSATDALSNAAAISSSASSVSLTAQSADLTSSGAISGLTGVTLDATGAITDSGTIAATDGSISMTAGADLTIAAASNISGTDVTATAHDDVSLASAITSTSGAIALTATTGSISAADEAAITATTDAALTAALDITGGGPITAAGTATLQASRNLAWDAAGAVAATGNIAFSAANTLSDSAALTSSAGTVTLTAQSSTLTTHAAVSGHAGVTYTSGASLSDTGAVTSAAGAVAFNAPGSITVAAASNLSGTSVTLTAGQDLSLASAVASTSGDVTLSAQAGSIAATDAAALTTAHNAAVLAGQNITGGGPVSAAGTVTFDADQSLAWDAAGSVHATGNIIFTAGSALTEDGALTSTNGMVALASLNAQITTDAAATAHGNITYNAATSIDDSGAITSAGNVGLTSGTTLVVHAASPLSGANVTLTAGSNLVVASPATSTTGDITMTAPAGTITTLAGAPLVSHGILTLSGGNGITTGDTLASTAALILTAPHGPIALASAKTIQSGFTVALLAGGGSLTLPSGADINAPNAVILSSSTTINTAANITTAGPANFSGAVNLTGNVAISAGTITLNSTLDGARMLTLNATGNITLQGAAGSITPLTGIAIGSVNNFTAAAITAGQVVQDGSAGVIALSAITTTNSTGVIFAGKQITAAGQIHSAGPVHLSAGQMTITSTGSIASSGDLVLTGSGMFTLQNGATLTAGSGGNLVITSDNPSLGSIPNTLTGTGLLVLQPATDTTQIDIGAVGPQFDLTPAEIGTIAPGFSQVIIGRGTGQGFNSGDNGDGAIDIFSANFNTAVTFRSPGAEGPVTVNGTLSTNGANASLNVIAGGNVTVDGEIVTAGGGDISLLADADRDGYGSVLVAQTSPTTVTSTQGNVTMTGANVTLGSDAAAATVSAPDGSISLQAPGGPASGSGLVGATPGQVNGTGGTLNINNPNTTLDAGVNLDLGSSDGVHPPALVNIQGNLNAGNNIEVQSDGDANFTQYRGRAAGRIDVLADGNVNTNTGTLIAQGGPVDLSANGALNQTAAPVSQPSTLDLQTHLTRLNLGSILRAGDKGRATVTLTNTGSVIATGNITIVLYAAQGQTLTATDQVIGKKQFNIRIKPGHTMSFVINIAIPATLPPGDYYIAAEQLPYRGDLSVGADGTGIQITDPNVAFTPSTLSVQLPQITAHVNSTFDGKIVRASQAGAVTLTLQNTGSVRSIGSASIAFYLTTDGTLNSAIPLTTAVGNMTIPAGRIRKLRYSMRLPAGLDTTQSYSLIAVISPIATAINPAQADITATSALAFGVTSSTVRHAA
jgi:hypothetical protein